MNFPSYKNSMRSNKSNLRRKKKKETNANTILSTRLDSIVRKKKDVAICKYNYT